MLAEIGLVVELAATTKRAEKRMSTQSFDAIVLDLHARGMDAREFVCRVRADVRVADIPVLFLSSKPTSRDVVDAFASGGDDFLPKPFRTSELAARIFSLLRRARIARTAGSGVR
jgi:DNA-binding response OmpR family regulator